MQCPKCRLINPPSAERCDCGYDFATKSVKSSYLQGPSGESALVADIVRAVGRRDLSIGGAWLGLGAVATVATYVYAASHGGTYVVAYGAMAVGLIRVLRGLYRTQTGRPSPFWDGNPGP
jgi:hypothetical protein